MMILIIVFMLFFLFFIERSKLKNKNLFYLFLIIVSLGNYVNFGLFHGRNLKGDVLVAHPLEQFHYVLGSKYFKELEYNYLYEAAIIAMAENSNSPDFFQIKIRRMSDYRFINSSLIIDKANNIKSNFSSDRWLQFKNDVLVYYKYLIKYDYSKDVFFEMLNDHGFNGSPLFIKMTSPIFDIIPVSEQTITLFAMFDFFLIAIMLIAITAGMDLRTCAYFALMFGFCFSSKYSWIGGGFCRLIFLTSLVLGYVLLRNKKAISGFFFALAILLRFFPIFLVIGMLTNIIWQIKSQSLKVIFNLHRNFIIISVLSLVGLFLITFSNQVYPKWFSKLKQHSSLISANAIGLPSLLAYNKDYNLVHIRNEYLNKYARTDIGTIEGKEPSLSVYLGSHRAQIFYNNLKTALIFMAFSWGLFILFSKNFCITTSSIFSLLLVFISSSNLSGYYSCILPLIALTYSDKYFKTGIYHNTLVFLVITLFQYLMSDYGINLDTQGFVDSLSIIIIILVSLIINNSSLIKDNPKQ